MYSSFDLGIQITTDIGLCGDPVCLEKLKRKRIDTARSRNGAVLFIFFLRSGQATTALVISRGRAVILFRFLAVYLISGKRTECHRIRNKRNKPAVYQDERHA